MESSSDEILYVNFNQDQGCFACGTQSGFKVFNTSPF
jgi:WD repeat-containing protein 45